MAETINTLPESADSPAEAVATPKPKGRPRGGSRKGIPNRVTADVRAMVLAALEGAGGQEYLQRQAIEAPAAFMALLAKLIPTKIASSPPDTEFERRASVADDLRQRIDEQFAIEHANGIWGRRSCGS